RALGRAGLRHRARLAPPGQDRQPAAPGGHRAGERLRLPRQRAAHAVVQLAVPRRRRDALLPAAEPAPPLLARARQPVLVDPEPTLLVGADRPALARPRRRLELDLEGAARRQAV